MRLTRPETDALYVLACQAWELKEDGSPYFTDACEAIAAWNDRRRLARLEREQEQTARALRLLRESNAIVIAITGRKAA